MSDLLGTTHATGESVPVLSEGSVAAEHRVEHGHGHDGHGRHD
jgi:hypothetical protein